jgi:hypothetical protein
MQGLTVMPILLAGLITGCPKPIPIVVSTADQQDSSPPDDMGHNGLSNGALFNNALTMNPNALNVLLHQPLTSNIFSSQKYPGMKYQLRDPNARAVMQDLVSCALGPDSKYTITYTDTSNGNPITYSFPGELGFCSEEPNDWSSHPPTEHCQQLVSACLLARVNALQRRVPISLRLSESIRPTRPRVLIENKYRESSEAAGMDTGALSEGSLISSFAGYLPPPPSIVQAGSGALPSAPVCKDHPDCGWERAYIGTCIPATPGTSGKGNVLHRQGGCSSSIRICTGIYGCEDETWAQQSAAGYSARITEYALSGNNCPSSLTFECPARASQALDALSYSTYGVMIKRASGDSIALTTESADSSAMYQAPETYVFPFREGAFFGNLFESDGLTRICEVADQSAQPTCHPVANPAPSAGLVSGSPLVSGLQYQVPYLHVWACYSLANVAKHQDSMDFQYNSFTGIASFNDRICDLPGSGLCFPHIPDACDSRCDWNKEKRVYEKCRSDDNTGKTYPPITTYLDNPCSLVSPGQCAVLRRSWPQEVRLRSSLDDNHTGPTVPEGGASR